MNMIQNAHPIMDAIAAMVIDSLWQFSLVALVLLVILRIIPLCYVKWRYILSAVSIFVCAVLAIFSFGNQLILDGVDGNESSDVVYIHGHVISGIGATVDEYQSLSDWIFVIWFVGIVLLSFRFLVQYIRMKNYTSHHNVIENVTLNNKLMALLDNLKIDRPIHIYESAKVQGAIVFGLFKPIILFPVGLVNRLNPEELEQILLHEIAHIIRYDYIINILQSCLEILFYYHPAIWWISAQMRNERECACDHWTLTKDHSALSYAKLLVKLQEYASAPNPNVGLAFAGSSFSNRIKRLLNMKPKKSYLNERMSILLVLMSSIIIFSFTHSANSSDETRSPVVAKYDIFPAGCDTIPSKKSYSRSLTKTVEEDGRMEIIKETKEDNQSVKVEISLDAEGEIDQMKVNNKLIDKEDYHDVQEDFDINISDKRTSFYDEEIKDEIDDSLTKTIEDLEVRIEEWSESSEDLSEFFQGHSLSLSQDGNLLPLMDLDFGNGDMRIMIGPDNEILSIDVDELNNTMSIISDSLKLMQLDFQEWEGDMATLQLQMEDFQDQIIIDSERFQWNDQYDFEFPEIPESSIRIKKWSDKDTFTFPPTPPAPPTPPSFGNRKHSFSYGNTLSDKMSYLLNKDGLLEPDQNNEIELSGKHLKINGEKQPSNIHSKYKDLYESYIGAKLNKKSKIILDILGQKRKFKNI